ncbi:MAG: thioredoxin [Betaproteobacteria bacterium]|nr:thioredoxin [Betaproteobacteria bacterium]
MIDVTLQNFEADVIEASFSQPVLVDFWASWCGPCKALGPILEKLEGVYAGRFTLAKIDSDAEQQLAGAFGVRSIPTVILMKNGQPVDGFVGALPEGQIRQFLDKHVPTADELTADAQTQVAEDLAAQGDTRSALDKLREALAINPANDEARFDYVRLLLDEGRLDDARMAFEPLAAKSSKAAPVARIDALGAYLGACMALPHARSADALQAAIAADRRDFAARYELAQRHFAERRFEAALDELLEILMRDKAWNDNAARRLYVAILELLTPPRKPAKADAATGTTASGIALTGKQAAVHDDPHAALVADYRRRLSMVLF